MRQRQSILERLNNALVSIQDACSELQRRLSHLQKIAACNAKDGIFVAQVRPFPQPRLRDLGSSIDAVARYHVSINHSQPTAGDKYFSIQESYCS